MIDFVGFDLVLEAGIFFTLFNIAKLDISSAC